VATVVASTPAGAQIVRERDTKITGPRGRTVERQLESRITPGGIDRETIIRRPGGATLERDVHISRSPVFNGGGGGFGPAGPGRNVFVERNVFINNRPGWGGGWSPLANFGLGAAVGTGAGLLLGSALSSPPPPPVFVSPAPVFVMPAPVYVAPPIVAGPPPVQYLPAQPQTVVVDQVPIALERLRSYHDSSRLDACVTLGRLGDPRGVPALIDRLKNDHSKDVKIAAATALGLIGDPNSAIVLERCTIYEKKQEVRDAAAMALAQMQQRQAQAQAQASAAASAAQTGGSGMLSGPSRTAIVPSLGAADRVPPPPTPGFGPRR
jgi:HEAT repeats